MRYLKVVNRDAAVVGLVLTLAGVGMVVVSCLTPDEKARQAKQEATVAELASALERLKASPKAEDQALVPDAVLAFEKAKADLEALKLELSAIRRERGVQIASWAVDGMKHVLPFIPYGEIAVPLVGLAGMVLQSMKRGGSNG